MRHCQVRALGLARGGVGGIEGFLLKAVTPPGAKAICNALDLLLHVGALCPDESLTPLGRHLAALPMEPQMGKGFWIPLGEEFKELAAFSVMNTAQATQSPGRSRCPPCQSNVRFYPPLTVGKSWSL
eukprot:4623789-Pyramimonas_sp.AAC.1